MIGNKKNNNKNQNMNTNTTNNNNIIIDNKQNSVIPGKSNGPGGSTNASGIDTESNSALPKAPSPRPDSLSSNEELKGNI